VADWGGVRPQKVYEKTVRGEERTAPIPGENLKLPEEGGEFLNVELEEPPNKAYHFTGRWEPSGDNKY